MTDYERMVCPHCGWYEFEQRRAALVEQRIYVVANGGRIDVSEEILDLDDEPDSITCGDCGTELYDEDLVSEDSYNDA